MREESKERAMGNFKRGERNSKVLKRFMWIFHVTMEL